MFPTPRLRVLSLSLLSAALGTAAQAQTQACRIDGVPTELQCGSLARPLDPSKPQGPLIDIHYVVVPAMARNKIKDPVLMLAGGPGQSAIQVAPLVLPRLARLNNRRDLVFIDQRGTGRSAPLPCPDDSKLPTAEALDGQAVYRRLEQCREALQKLPHGDLRQYTTTLAMQDFDAVRAALGVERWNLVGASYGTRAALEYQRQFPERVRRSVIDGVAPPDMALPASFSTDGQAALEAVFKSCEQQPACQARYPRLRAEWAGLLQSLPRSITLTHPLSGEPERFTMSREMLLRAVRQPLYVPAQAAALPAAIHAAHEGRFEGLAGLSGTIGGGKAGKLAMGMHFSVVCAEDLPRLPHSQDAPGKDFGRHDAELYSQACKHWPRGEVPAAFYTLPPSSTPVLVLSGGADPATPPRHGERVAKALGPQALHVVVPEAGHGVTGLGCMGEVLTRFIDAKQDSEALQIDASCATRIPRPTAILPPQPTEQKAQP